MTVKTSRLFQLLDTHIEAPLRNFEHILENSTLISVAADTTLMQVNQLQKYFYVVESGLLRAVFVTSEGREYSKEFFWEKDVVFGMRGLITNEPIPYAVLTVEPCQLYQISLSSYQDLVKKYVDWKDYHIRQVETHLLYKEIKEELLLLNSNEQKVERVYQLFPDLVNRVPATLIASYLGLSPVSLSRIKKRLELA